VRFEWDRKKEQINVAKHGVSFREAKELFTSKGDFLELYDGEHSELEERFIAIGPIRRGSFWSCTRSEARTRYASLALAGPLEMSERSTWSTLRRGRERNS